MQLTLEATRLLASKAGKVIISGGSLTKRRVVSTNITSCTADSDMVSTGLKPPTHYTLDQAPHNLVDTTPHTIMSLLSAHN